MAKSISLKVIAVTDKDQFKSACSNLRATGNFFRAQVQASIGYVLTEYTKDNFGAVNILRKIVADKKVGVKEFDRYINAHSNGSIKDGKMETKAKHGKRTMKALDTKWYADKLTADDLRAEASKLEGEAADELNDKADAMEVAAQAKAQWHVIAKHEQYIVNLEKAMEGGNVDNTALLTQAIVMAKRDLTTLQSLSLQAVA